VVELRDELLDDDVEEDALGVVSVTMPKVMLGVGPDRLGKIDSKRSCLLR